MSDRVLGAMGIGLAAFFIWQASLIHTSFISDPVGAKTFPIIVGILLATASAFILLRPDSEPVWPSAPRLLEIGLAASVLVAYAMALPTIGFVLSTAVAATFLAWRLGAPPLRAVLAGAAISIGIFVVFRLILGLSLARGPLGF